MEYGNLHHHHQLFPGDDDSECPLPEILVLSDLHLGHNMLRRKKLHAYLEEIPDDVQLVLAGDTLDGDYFYKDYELLHPILNKAPIILGGNHDSRLLFQVYGIPQVDYLILWNVLVTHGHLADPFCQEYPKFYNFIQRYNRWTWNDWLYWKIDNREKIKSGIIDMMHQLECNSVICGHTHRSCNETNYINLGCWINDDQAAARIVDGYCYYQQL